MDWRQSCCLLLSPLQKVNLRQTFKIIKQTSYIQLQKTFFRQPRDTNQHYLYLPNLWCRNKTILWWLLNLSYEEADSEEKTFFGDGDLETRLGKYDELDESQLFELLDTFDQAQINVSSLGKLLEGLAEADLTQEEKHKTREARNKKQGKTNKKQEKRNKWH